MLCYVSGIRRKFNLSNALALVYCPSAQDEKVDPSLKLHLLTLRIIQFLGIF